MPQDPRAKRKRGVALQESIEKTEINTVEGRRSVSPESTRQGGDCGDLGAYGTDGAVSRTGPTSGDYEDHGVFSLYDVDDEVVQAAADPPQTDVNRLLNRGKAVSEPGMTYLE